MLSAIKSMSGCVCLLLAASSLQIARAQSPQERHDQIRASLQSGNTAAAITQLRAFRTANTAVFSLNGYDYLLARLAERSGDLASASASYLVVVAGKDLLAQHALWHLSQIARTTGDLNLERERLRQLVAIQWPSLLTDAATMRLAQSYLESGDYANAISTSKTLSASKNSNIARQAITLSAQANLLSNHPAEGRELFIKLVTQLPDISRPDDFALAAVRALDQLDRTNTASSLSEIEHLLRASIYNFNRDFDGARTHYLAIVQDYPQSGRVPESLFQVGRGFSQQGKNEEALQYFNQLQQQYPASGSARDALLLLGATNNRLKRTDAAIAAYKLLLERFPDAPNPERPYLNIIDTLRDAGRDDEAIGWVRQTRARFKDQIGGTLALFAQAKLHLAQSAWAAAIADTEELQRAGDLGGLKVPGGTTPTEVSFLRAFALEQAGRIDDAVSAYLAIPEGRNEYYGFRANERLRALDANAQTHATIAVRGAALSATAKQAIETNQAEQARQAAQSALRITSDTTERGKLLGIVRRTYAALPNYTFPNLQEITIGRREVMTAAPQIGTAYINLQRAYDLFFLGLYDEGVPEFTDYRGAVKTMEVQPSTGQSGAARNNLSTGELDYTLAVYALRGGLANQAIRFAEQIWKSMPRDYMIEVAPPQMVELLYPAPYRESLLQHAVPRGVDPRFLLAIARQESRFKADAKSVSAARGLMQFIAATADDTAKQLGRRSVNQDEMYNPDTAIQFGSQYLASLFKQFPALPQAVAGAYNGGPDNLARWIARSHRNDPDTYVAEIGFSQTKEYVFIVMSNFWVYQQLYSDQLQRK
jgi:soluble lytic murein transglycosylase